MATLLEHIDAIARKKQRDVLYVIFDLKSHVGDDFDFLESYKWRDDSIRETICNWLTEHQITWKKCGDIATEYALDSYRGQIYLDVPFDDNDPVYVLVRDYLENPDGSMRFETVVLCYLPLAIAMENAHHDEPGFWEKWAEDF